MPEQFDTTVNPGDIIIAYSDGLTETRDIHGGLFDVTGIAAAVAVERHRTPQDIADAIITAAKDHSGLETPEDDQMVVVIQIGPEYLEFSSGAKTLELVSEGEYALINAADSITACDGELYSCLEKCLGTVEVELVGRAWNAVWEAILNALHHGSDPGDVITVRFGREGAVLKVEIEQPKEWRDWDLYLRALRANALKDGHLGTATIRQLANETVVSKQGRCVALVFDRTGGKDDTRSR
jgi:anti-sigma regulatory factor (Ser/Thr protein kinase)